MNILGISAYFHDSAAAVVGDGRVIAAAQEERFTRIKHDSEFPRNAVAYCLSEGGLKAADLDYVVFYEKPLMKFERLLETYLAYAPRGLRSFKLALPLWLRQKLHLRREMRRALGKSFRGRFVFTEHHESHAASAFFPSPFEEAALLTVDGVGEWATTTIGRGEASTIRLLKELHFPHSLGLLYSAFTYYCGFRVNSGEYKLMGLAPYGEPAYADLIRQQLIDLKPDGSFRMDLRYFNFCQGLTMTNNRFHQLFGAPPRRAEGELTQHYMDVGASIQTVTEEIMLRLARTAHKLTGSKNLCLAGGVALNCVANGRILREGPFENVWIQPAAGDAGGALGAALFTWHQLLEKPRAPQRHSDGQEGSFLGPAYDDEKIKRLLDERGAVYRTIADRGALNVAVARLLGQEKVVGWFQGRMEFGPRALGHRSILGDARSSAMQKVMNLKIKFRESFRPFAPAVLRDRVADYFDMRSQEESPYMLLVAGVHQTKRCVNGTAVTAVPGLQKLYAKRSIVPAITHVDYSARVQTVDGDRNPEFHALLEEFERQTGCPVLINTSFNVRGEPIVCSPNDAWRCFMGTNMDVLVVGSHLLEKENQPGAAGIDNSGYLAQFALD